MYRIAAMATLGVFLWSAAFAQDSTNPEGVEKLAGGTATAKLSVPVREAPPEGFLALPGKKIDELQPTTKYQIRDAKVLPYVFSTQTWVLLGHLNSDKELGWSYFGEDASKSTNFDWQP